MPWTSKYSYFLSYNMFHHHPPLSAPSWHCVWPDLLLVCSANNIMYISIMKCHKTHAPPATWWWLALTTRARPEPSLQFIHLLIPSGVYCHSMNNFRSPLPSAADLSCTVLRNPKPVSNAAPIDLFSSSSSDAQITNPVLVMNHNRIRTRPSPVTH